MPKIEETIVLGEATEDIYEFKADQQDLMSGEQLCAEDPRLGRIPHLDERSREFPVRAVLRRDQTKPMGKNWYLTLRLDQGNPIGIIRFSPSGCTGHSRTYDFAASPKPLKMPPIGKSRTGPP